MGTYKAFDPPPTLQCMSLLPARNSLPPVFDHLSYVNTAWEICKYRGRQPGKSGHVGVISLMTAHIVDRWHHPRRISRSFCIMAGTTRSMSILALIWTSSDIMWHHLMSCDITWHHVTAPDVMWHHLTSCDSTWHLWQHLTSCDITWHLWHHVTSPDVMWQHLTSPDIMWQHLTSPDIMWQITTTSQMRIHTNTKIHARIRIRYYKSPLYVWRSECAMICMMKSLLP